ncbi:thiamine pyrophosphate-binding protein [Sulfuritalea hydrogenivorans]|uniref:Thiamine pyrophosphate enzyme-like protein n=1 Tax=Sulfuritalea hydrogenivorans sk43H TaxID=1223802 RepID=W0SIQ0_9PROT|nr:thiamine pyrophosphate-binding protein [Sulfuritalea hydrogenivorans]MDK9714079.1 thiamine pyrophosphate-binding protein [Sulfuritalea sp.]BAO30461.1 thiamine pyrophosphate enzyme-like protein [Sulfuritalea hydrogenivorans sk43H]
MKRTGAWLAVRALEALGIKYTFGIPGVHNTELYDELNSSDLITPILVTHEGGASFMADGVSRTSGQTGTLVIVPAAGATHAASGIGEAFLDGVPMLVICGGIRTDLDKRYQLHQMDQHAFLKPLTKATFLVTAHADIVPTLFKAWEIAHSGEPGPVFVEIPVNLQMFPGEAGDIPAPPAIARPQPTVATDIRRAAEMLLAAKHPAMFVGWGARDAHEQTRAIAEFLQAPVATTLQGLSVFSAAHPLHTGFSFGASAVPAARNAFADCDCLLAVGTRFAEIATGSFGVTVPPNLIHADINPAVFSANYPAAVALEGDAAAVLTALLEELRRVGAGATANVELQQRIARDKAAYNEEWLRHDSGGKVNPAVFFNALRAAVPDDAIAVVDDGNHTYLTAELFPVRQPKALIVPTDFNSMGYAVPAAIGAKLANPGREVFAIIGDGAFTMTCMEIVSATRIGLGLVFYVFHDGELSQIAQAQEIPFNRKPCTALGAIDFSGVAIATGAEYLPVPSNDGVAAAIARARELAAAGRPVIVDLIMDYSKRTTFTLGAVKTNFRRFPLAQRLRMVTRAIKRKITG